MLIRVSTSNPRDILGRKFYAVFMAIFTTSGEYDEWAIRLGDPP